MIKVREKYALDERDETLIKLLTNDGRMTITDMAKHLGVTRPAVMGRISRLQTAGVIKGFVVVVDWDQVMESDEVEERIKEWVNENRSKAMSILRGEGEI